MKIKSFIKNHTDFFIVLTFTIIIALLVYFNPYKIISNNTNFFIFLISLSIVIITSLITYHQKFKDLNSLK